MKKNHLKPKSSILFLSLLLALLLTVPAKADSMISTKTTTTSTFNTEGGYIAVSFSEDFSLGGNNYQDTGRYRLELSVTPVYDSIWVTYDSGKRVNLAKDPSIVRQINENVSIYEEGTEMNPNYDASGSVTSFTYSKSGISATGLISAGNFSVSLPDNDSFPAQSESNRSDYEDDEEDFDEDDIRSVRYSVRFKVKGSVYGNAAPVKLKKKTLTGYISDIWYFVDVVDTNGGNTEIVKAKSSNPAVAAVSASTKRIRMKKTGTAKITLTNAYGRSATFTVKVKASTITRRLSSVNCMIGTEMDLDSSGIVGILGTPRYTVRSSNSSIVSVRKSLNHPIIRARKAGSATLTFTCGKKKFNVRVRATKASVVFSSSVTLTKGSSRSLSAAGSSSGIYIRKAVSLNGLLSLKLSSDAKTLTLTANKDFSGSSATEKVLVTFNNGTKKTVTVKINKKAASVKPFSLKDIKIKLIRSYWNGSKACIEYSVTNNSSKNLNKVRIFYSGTLNETVSGYTTINSSIPKGTTKTFITRVKAFDYLEGVTLKVTSAS